MKHFSQVIVNGNDDGTVTITLRCQQCAGATFTLSTAHLETLARVLPDVARQAGIDLDATKTETLLFETDTPEARAEADRAFVAFVAARRAVTHEPEPRTRPAGRPALADDELCVMGGDDDDGWSFELVLTRGALAGELRFYHGDPGVVVFTHPLGLEEIAIFAAQRTDLIDELVTRVRRAHLM